MSAEEFQELKILSTIEPVGIDALIYQMARCSQSMGGGEFKKHLVISTKAKQSPETIKKLFEALRRGNNSNTRHRPAGKND